MLPKFDTLVREIKSKRNELGWSQRDLARKIKAKHSDDITVSKSLIGKLETKSNVPQYDNVWAIYDVLYSDEVGETADKYKTADIQTVELKDTVEHAAKIMKENDFSQLPVVDGFHRYKGLILSTDLMDVEDRQKRIEDIKIHTLPRIPENTPKENFKDLFDTHKAVLVERDGEVIGILTPADLL